MAFTEPIGALFAHFRSPATYYPAPPSQVAAALVVDPSFGGDAIPLGDLVKRQIVTDIGSGLARSEEITYQLPTATLTALGIVANTTLDIDVDESGVIERYEVVNTFSDGPMSVLMLKATRYV